MATYTAKFNKHGNIKTGGSWNFSKLAGNTEYTVDGETIVGSCGNHCLGCWSEAIKNGKRPPCYVAKSYRYPSVVKSHFRNTKAFRDDLEKAFQDLDKSIERAKKKPAIIRINQSGEIESTKEFFAWCEIARKHPDIKYWLYSKAFEEIEPALNDMPENMTLLVSVWHEYGIEFYKKYSHLNNVKAFVYMDGYDYSKHNLSIGTMCHAYDEKGKLNHDITCDKCKKCFNRCKSCKVIGCNDH